MIPSDAPEATALTSKRPGKGELLSLISCSCARDSNSSRSASDRVLVMVRDHLLLMLALGAFQVEPHKLKLINHLIISFHNERQN